MFYITLMVLLLFVLFGSGWFFNNGILSNFSTLDSYHWVKMQMAFLLFNFIRHNAGTNGLLIMFVYHCVEAKINIILPPFLWFSYEILELFFWRSSIFLFFTALIILIFKTFLRYKCLLEANLDSIVCVFTFWVPCCNVRYDFRIKNYLWFVFTSSC